MKYTVKGFFAIGLISVFISFASNCCVLASGNVTRNGLDLKNIQDAPEEICADS